MLRRLPKKCYANSPSSHSILSFATLSSLIQQRTAREKHRLFLADGLRFVHAALSSPYFRPEAVFYSPALATHPGISDVRAQIRARNIPEVRLTPEQFRSLAQSPEPQGIGVVVRISNTNIRHAPPDAGLCWLAIDTIRSPGNLGTIMRTAEAVGAASIVCVGEGAEAIDPLLLLGPSVKNLTNITLTKIDDLLGYDTDNGTTLYLEVQIHGGVTSADILRIEAPSDIIKDEEIQQWANFYGILLETR
jgi:hypothetical protein